RAGRPANRELEATSVHPSPTSVRERGRSREPSGTGETAAESRPAKCRSARGTYQPELTMDHFTYRDRVLYCEDLPVPQLAEAYGTPLFVYSQATLLHHLGQVQKAFAPAAPLICYSIKTNGNLGLCKVMARAGSGFDVTSGGELYRALRAGSTGD